MGRPPAGRAVHAMREAGAPDVLRNAVVLRPEGGNVLQLRREGPHGHKVQEAQCRRVPKKPGSCPAGSQQGGHDIHVSVCAVRCCIMSCHKLL